MAVRRDALVRLLLLTVAARGASGAKVPAMFVFGDSTADVGNNDYLPGSSARANFPHNGVDFPGGKPTGRFSNGLIGVDFLAFSMGFKKSPPPYLSLVANAANSSSIEVTRNVTKAAASYMTGANFAPGGSGILDSTGTTINMTKQLEYFSDLKDQMKTRLNANRVSALMSKSIFLISAGGNDAFDFFSQNKSPTTQEFSNSLKP
ncbi:hypothetical protein PR202_gb06027 [Eleusine coracana subsp. coracana]|uniref:GDSL esterase/lipase n=1 Tax=Eleusine coracana subsp. coracana TaxID=191504 RepID=A0AAV5E630_ELECO|nr:hypothetical protein PR202_gb06027 [Eleusine coracana subsp. coracana]